MITIKKTPENKPSTISFAVVAKKKKTSNLVMLYKKPIKQDVLVACAE